MLLYQKTRVTLGGDYGSIQVRIRDRAAVKAAAELVARAKNIHCLVGPETNGWVGIYPENNGQDQTVAVDIAKHLDADVLHLLVYDDSVLAYRLWRKHQLVDSYCSAPGYFGEENHEDEEKQTGDPRKFLPIIGEMIDRLPDLLDRKQSPVLESERLRKLAKLLRISNAVTAYEYLNEGNFQGIEERAEFELVPADPAAESKPKRASTRNRIQGEIRKCKENGLLLGRDVRKQQCQARVCTVADGFLIFRVDYPKVSVEHQCAPWNEPRIIPFDEATIVVTVSSDAAGHRVATAELDRVRIWDWASGQFISKAEIRETRATIAAVSPSGKLIAYCSATEFVVAGIDPRQQILRVPAKPELRIAFHPSQQWIAASSGPFAALYSLAEQPHRRELRVGGKWAPYAVSPRGQEYVLDVGFSRDGRWMWCGTSGGLRVYEWASVPREADSDLLNPRYSFNPPAGADSQFATYIHTIVEEIDAPAIVFAGNSECLYRLDLSDGSVRVLAKLPGVGVIRQLLMSNDGTALGLSGRAPGPHNLSGHQKLIWNVWSYLQLRGSHL